MGSPLRSGRLTASRTFSFTMTTADLTQPGRTDLQRRLTASIVIPVHNKATITRQCLDALLAEPEDGIARQLVVVDDGSTDMTPSLLARYSDRVLVIRNEMGSCRSSRHRRRQAAERSRP